MNNQLEHPAITRTLATGYPTLETSTIICSVCGEEIHPDSVYGSGDIDVLGKCCEDELDKQFKSLTFSEKLVALGMDVKYNG